MNILFVTLAENFVNKGFLVDLVLAHKSGPLLDELGDGINIVDLKSLHPGRPEWVSAFRTLICLISYLKKSPPDSLLSTLTGANLIAILARMISSRKVRLVVREAASLTNVKSRLRLKMMRLLYRYADEVIVLTDFMKKELVHSVGLSSGAISVIGNPIDCERINKLSDLRDEEQLIDELSPYVIVVGRLEEQKGCFDAIDAFVKFAEEQDHNLILIGDGSQREAIENHIKYKNMDNRIFLLGKLNNPFPWIKKSKLHVISSRWEGYPNILLESMCLGKSIVVTEYDNSLRDILSEYPSSSVRIVPLGDILGIAESMLELIKQKSSIESLWMQANVEEIADKYLCVLGATCIKSDPKSSHDIVSP
ncbi:MAG: glycosyltransferase [Candidatus Thiodiazotropha sp.]